MTGFGEPMPTNTAQTENPVTFLNFNGKEGVFSRKDSSGERVEQKLDKLILLNVAYKIDGRSDKYGCGLYSEESDSWNGPFNVKKTSDKTTVIEGDYQDIKDRLKDLGSAKLNFSLTLQADKGIYNVKLKGMAYKKFSDFLNNIGDKKNSHYIVLDGMESHKNGAIEYKTPNFVLGDELTDEEKETARFMYESLYVNSNNE